jgi:multiple sugar transport system substrate-binding protein
MGMIKRRTLLAGVPGLALTAAASRAQAATSLHVIYAYYSDATAGIMRDVVADFQASNPGVTINAEEIGWDNLQQRLTTDISGNTAPDVAVIATRWLLDWATQGVAEPLDDYASASFKSQFYDTLLKPSSVGGKLYGVPFDASTRALYYNKDLLQQAGVAAPPATWDELRIAAGKVKQAGKSYGFAIQGKEIETDTYWYYSLWSHGGEIVVNGKSAIASPAGIAATQLYKQLIDEGLTQPTPTAFNRQDVEALFKQGRAAMIATGPWLLGQIKTDAPKLNFGVVGIPKGTMEATWGGTDSVVMLASGEKKQLAWKFISEAMITPKSVMALTLKEGFLPVMKVTAEDPAVKSQLGAFTALLPYAQFAPQIPNWEQVVDITIAALQTVYLGRAEPAAALQKAAAQINPLIS